MVQSLKPLYLPFYRQNKEKDSSIKVRLNVIYSDDINSENLIKESLLI